ncbi:MAG: TIGR01777 family oxidoreductase [Bacteroidales bacterium]|nr:TIGR01777 family oxidoreductase [Bacteroidales bacterium]
MDKKQKSTVLITGGNGLVGSTLLPMLHNAGYSLRILTRGESRPGLARPFKWDIQKGSIEEGALEGLDHIIHLAGENIGSGRWTKSRRKKIIDSRILSARLLFDAVEKRNPELKSFTSASATGYYGALTTEKIFNENDPPGDDFAARVCIEWEEAAGLFRSGGYRTSIVRTGIVLSKNGGMLARVLPAINMRFLPLFGNGMQALPWIHIEDLCGIYLKILSDSNIDGIYNAVAPEHSNYRDFIRTLSSVKKQKLLMPPTPVFPWKLLFGEKASMLLEGSRVSPEKIIAAGYCFRHPFLKDALARLID